MKSTLIRHFFVILMFIPGIIIFNACSKKLPGEVKVPDFITLSGQFSEPPREYTTAPFFVWNADITKEEVEKHMNSFKNAGSSQVFIHPRPGLITEYLSENWFELYQYTVEKGKELGMDVWIYDENSYPSGFAGGHVPNEMPESFNQGQGLIMTRFETLPDTCDKYYLCLKEEAGSYTDITSSLTVEKGKTGKYLLFSKTYYGKSDWYAGFSYVDLLLPGVTQKFIELTMTGYEKYIGTEFGKTVPGTFTDEPEIPSRGVSAGLPTFLRSLKTNGIMISEFTCLHFMKRQVTGKKSDITIHKPSSSCSSTDGQNHGMHIVKRRDLNLPGITGSIHGRT